MATLVRTSHGAGLAASAKLKDKGGFYQRLSKVATPGATYRLFFPTFQMTEDGELYTDVIAGYACGRKLDFNIFGQSFMAYSDKWYEVDEDDDTVVYDVTNMPAMQRIGKVIYEAKCESEKQAARDEAKALAQANGGEVNETALIRKLDRIDEKYHGREAEEGSAKINPTENYMISGLQTNVILECLVVPMDPTTNTPKWDEAEYAYKEASKKFINTLLSLMADPNYFNPSNYTGYFEVSFTYGQKGQTAKEAGTSTTISGITPALGLENQFPDSWKAKGKDKVAGLTNGSRDIEDAGKITLKHAGISAGRISPKEVESKLREWTAKNMIILTHIDTANDATKKGAKDLLKSGFVDNLSMVKDKLSTIVTDEEDEEEPTATAATPAESQLDSAPVHDPAPATEPVINSDDTMHVTQQAHDAGMGLASATVADIPEDDELGDLLS